MNISPVENLKCLVGVPADDVIFKSALGDATLETLDTAMEMRGLAGKKTAFAAIRAEIKRRMDESGMDAHDLETFDMFRARWEKKDFDIRTSRELLASGKIKPESITYKGVTLRAKEMLSAELLARHIEDFTADLAQLQPQPEAHLQTTPIMKSSITLKRRAAAQPNNTLAGSPFATARQHAERACQLGEALGQEVSLCGLELIRLYELYGGREGRPSKTTTACGSFNDCKTWPELVKREVGISDETARRWMQIARAQLPAIAGQLGYLPDGEDAAPINAAEESAVLDIVAKAEPARLAEVVAKLSNGKTLEQLLIPLDAAGKFDPAKLVGKARECWERIGALCDPFDDDHLGPTLFDQEAYDAMHEDALRARERVEAGELAPTRAWAGIMGRAAADGNGGRSATDHYRNLHTGLTKLRNSFAHWDDLTGGQREEVEVNWAELWQSIPSVVKATVKKLEGWK